MKGKKLIVSLSLIIWGFVSCQSEEPPPPPPEVTLKIVYPAELKNYLEAVNAAFVQKFASAPNAMKVSVELVAEPSISAYKKIARGEIKAAVWLPSDPTLVELTNHAIKNLGAKQIDCSGLFSTPVVVATQQRFMQSFHESNNVFSWREFFQGMMVQINETKSLESVFSYSLGNIERTSSGIPAAIQLAMFARQDGESDLTVEQITSDGVQNELKRLLLPMSYFANSESQLMDHSTTPGSSRVIFSLTTEQQLIDYNIRVADPSATLTALYPSEGSYWQNYSACLSDADWVSSDQKAIAATYLGFLKDTYAQGEAFRRGFRPMVAKVDKAQDPFTKRYGVAFDGPSQNQFKATSKAFEYLTQHFEELSRPVSRTFILDTSGTTGGATITAGLKLGRIIFANSKPRDISSLITFADRPSVLISSTKDSGAAVRSLDGLQGVGGSAIYDAVAQAVNLNSKDEFRGFRKSIYLFTDGKDNKSTASLQDLLDLLKDRRRNYDFDLEIIAVATPDVDFSDLQSIAKATDGRFQKIFATDIDRFISEMPLSQR